LPKAARYDRVIKLVTVEAIVPIAVKPVIGVHSKENGITNFSWRYYYS
jgi:hypothetical protein